MRIFFLMFSPFLAIPAFAQSNIQTRFDAEITILTASGVDRSAVSDPRGALSEVSLTAGAEYLFESGLELSGRLTFRAQTDHPARPGFAGALIACPAETDGCPGIFGSGVRGAFSRVSSLGADDETGGFGNLESAYITLDGGWGEIGIGRDQGVAQRFYEGGPTVFRLGQSNNAVLDPFGTALTRTRNDISASAEKISLVSTRILGVRAGVSYTPDASFKGLDLNSQYTRTGVIEPDIGETWEAGLQASRVLRDADLRLRGSLTWSEAVSQSEFYDDVTTISGGFEIERRDVFRLGFSALESSNGGLGQYRSLAAGGSWWFGDWVVTASADQSEDELVQIKAVSGTVGASRSLNKHIDVTIGYRARDTDLTGPVSLPDTALNQSGVLLEVRIRK